MRRLVGEENLLRILASASEVNDFFTWDNTTSVKDKLKRFGATLVNVVKKMTYEEILESDTYLENGKEKHEMIELIQELLGMA